MNKVFFKTEIRKITDTDIFYYENIDESDSCIVFIVHGLSEHAARYEKIGAELKSSNIGCAAVDLPGHGKTSGGLEGRGIWPDSGFEFCIEIVRKGIENLSEKYKKPVILFGHSMGAFISLGYIGKFGSQLEACIISGSNDTQPPALLKAGKLMASIVSGIRGKNYSSKLLDNMSYGSFNNHFKPNRTAFDWLSRDNKEVDKYINDDYCGFIASSGLFQSFLDGLSAIYSDENISGIPESLPIHIFSGSKDPVGDFGKGPELLSERIKSSGVKDVSIKIYKDARHECLNEINRDEVVADIIDFVKGLKVVN